MSPLDIEDVLAVLLECEELVPERPLRERIRAAYQALSVWVAKDRIATQREVLQRRLRVEAANVLSEVDNARSEDGR